MIHQSTLTRKGIEMLDNHIPTHTNVLHLPDFDVTFVCFVLPPDIARLTEKAFLVGDFNGWDQTSDPMASTNDADQITLVMELDKGKEYQYRFLVITKDGNKEWHNDWHADSYRTNPFGGDNSVIHT